MRIPCFAALCAIFGASVIWAADVSPQPLTAEEQKAVVASIAEKIGKEYSVPELGEKMVARLKERTAQGAYEGAKAPEEFAKLVTAHLREVSQDGHLRVRWSATPLPKREGGSDQPSAAEREQFRQRLARENFGIPKMEILPGNIGYVDLRYFTFPEWAAETYTSAFQYVGHTDALIIDLRSNGGSMSPDSIPYFASYLFAEPVQTIEMYWRPTNERRQFWTYAWVPGKRYLQKPVYLLTSRRTFSGAEEFAYDLKNHKRATLIGETTGGGANPGGEQRINDHFALWLPVGQVTSPITKTNWEVVGVKPDVEVPAAGALAEAQRRALTGFLAVEKDPERREALQKLFTALAPKDGSSDGSHPLK